MPLPVAVERGRFAPRNVIKAKFCNNFAPLGLETLVTKAFYLLQEVARFGTLRSLLIVVYPRSGQATSSLARSLTPLP